MAREKELMELVRQETHGPINQRERRMFQLRKEMDMEIPELTVKTDTSAHVSLKWPSPSVNIMTPPQQEASVKDR